MKKSMKHIGEELRIIRKGLGLSQKDLALNSNISVDTIVRIEKNKFFPRLDSLIAISNSLGLDFENIFLSSVDSKIFLITDKIDTIKNNLKTYNIDDVKHGIYNLRRLVTEFDEDLLYKNIILENTHYFKAMIKKNIENDPKSALLELEEALKIFNGEYSINKIVDIKALKLSNFQKIMHLKILEILDFKLFEKMFKKLERYLERDKKYYVYCIYQKIKIYEKKNYSSKIVEIIDKNIEKIKYDYIDYIIFLYIKYTCNRKKFIELKHKSVCLCDLFELTNLKERLEKDISIEDLIF